MKIHLSTASCLIFILLSQISHSLLVNRDVSSSAEGFELAKEVSEPSTSGQPSKPVVDGVGTKDAPIDGKDGRPHLGPFVETSAERDRKKAKESGDEVPKQKALGKASNEGLPASNDGVMDDPNRKGPKEGTRGTEGGISEKTKDIKDDKKDSAEKKPDPPKEAPPLPHSEQTKLDKQAGKVEDTVVKDKAVQDGDKKDDTKKDGKKDEKEKQPGGLEVGGQALKDAHETDNDLETCRSPKKTTRYSTSSTSDFEQERPPGYFEAIYRCPTFTYWRQYGFDHAATTFLRPFTDDDHLLRDWRQNFPGRCTNGHETSSFRSLLGCIHSSDCNDHPLGAFGSHSTTTGTEAIR